jgi:alcohol dehydrogenase class IV
MGQWRSAFTIPYSLGAVKKIYTHLLTSYHDGANAEAREAMLNASFEAGIAFTRANVGSCMLRPAAVIIPVIIPIILLMIVHYHHSFHHHYHVLTRTNCHVACALLRARRRARPLRSFQVGYVHAIAHTFGGLFHTPHGVANAMLLPHLLDFYR